MKRLGFIYDYMIGLELRSYDDDDGGGLYEIDNDKDGWAFFFLEDVNTPFPKTPDDNKDNDYDKGLLVASTDTGVRIICIRCNPGGGP